MSYYKNLNSLTNSTTRGSENMNDVMLIEYVERAGGKCWTQMSQERLQTLFWMLF